MTITDAVLKLRGESKRQRVVAREVGRSRSRVANIERVMKRAQPNWLAWVEQGKLKHKHLEAVLCLPVSAAENLLRRAMAGAWSAQRLRDEVKVAKGERGPGDPHSNADVAFLEGQLAELWATPVAIKTKPTGGGELVIGFTDNEVLEGLLERFGYRFE